MSVLLFIVILLVLVLIHELGHFLVAKISRIRVDEFAFGFPPRIASIKKGETRYALNLFPIGGYVKVYGENPIDVSLDDPDRERCFVNKPRWVQSAVVIAGVVMNWLLAWVLIWAALVIGVSTSAYDMPEGKTLLDPKLYITEVLEGSPADEAGLVAGDRILDIADGASALPTAELLTVGGFSGFVASHPTSTLTVRVFRDDETRTFTAVPRTGVNPQATSSPVIGVLLDIEGTLRFGFFEAGMQSVERTWVYTKLTAEGLYDFFASIFSGSADLTQVAGPVGIVKVVGEAAGMGLVPVLLLTALISLNLSIINLMPFPALDGGRLLFIVLEGIIRRPISASFQAKVNTVGFVILLVLMVLITYNDIIKL